MSRGLVVAVVVALGVGALDVVVSDGFEDSAVAVEVRGRRQSRSVPPSVDSPDGGGTRPSRGESSTTTSSAVPIGSSESDELAASPVESTSIAPTTVTPEPAEPVGLPDGSASAWPAPPVPVLDSPPASTVPTTTRPDLAAEVLARISYPWREQLPGWTIEFLGDRRGYRGATFPPERRIQIYVDRETPLEELVHITAHEIGHALDVTRLNDADRAAFTSLRGRDPRSAWWVADGATDFASGAGDWAECFAWSQGHGDGFASRLGGPPDVGQLAAMAVLLG